MNKVRNILALHGDVHFFGGVRLRVCGSGSRSRVLTEMQAQDNSQHSSAIIAALSSFGI